MSELIFPDNRGRLLLRPYLVDGALGYRVSVNPQTRAITLDPVMATLTAEELDDLKRNPTGFVELLQTAADPGDDLVDVADSSLALRPDDADDLATPSIH